MERSDIRGGGAGCKAAPDFASLNPGYVMKVRRTSRETPKPTPLRQHKSNCNNGLAALSRCLTP